MKKPKPEIKAPAPRRFTLLNRAACKRFALKLAANRHHKFNRVSEAALDRWESSLRVLMARDIDSMPSKGKTIK